MYSAGAAMVRIRAAITATVVLRWILSRPFLSLPSLILDSLLGSLSGLVSGAIMTRYCLILAILSKPKAPFLDSRWQN